MTVTTSTTDEQPDEQVEAVAPDPGSEAALTNAAINERGAAAEQAVAADSLAIEEREGKFHLGSFVGDSVEDVALKAAGAHREVHKTLTQTQQRAAAGQPVDLTGPGAEPAAPAAAVNAEGDDITDDEYKDWLQGEAMRLGLVPPTTPVVPQAPQPVPYGPVGTDPYQSMMSRQFIDQQLAALAQQEGGPQLDVRYRELAEYAIQTEDAQRLQEVVGEWQQAHPAGSMAFQMQLQQAQQQVQVQQQQAQDAQMRDAMQLHYQAGAQAYLAANTDAPQLDPLVGQYLQANPMALPTAQAMALQTGDSSAVTQVFNMAAAWAREQPGAAVATQQAGAEMQQQQQQFMEQEKVTAASLESGTAAVIDVDTSAGDLDPTVAGQKSNTKKQLDSLIVAS